MSTNTSVNNAEALKSQRADNVNVKSFRQRWDSYKKHPGSMILFLLVCLAALITSAVIVYLIAYILINGIPNLTPELFAWEYNTENVSMLPALINTLIMTVMALILAVPIGVFSAIYLVEYAKRGNKFVKIIRMTAETLSGIPSIVYGIFGFLIFVTAFKWSYSLIAGVLTLVIMILPLILRTTEEALMSVPDSYRQGSFGLGAGRLRTVFRIVLPTAAPGIFAGVILAIGRIVGESAALLFTSGATASLPTSLLSSTRTLSVHMYALLTEGFYTDQANATAVVLLVMVVAINALSSFVARKIGTKG